MNYERIEEAIFLNRENRFIAMVEKEKKPLRVHVPNTGRCRELFVPGVKVLLEGAGLKSKRKTPYSLVTVYKGKNPINIDSQAPNRLAAEFFDRSPYLPGFGKICSYRREVKKGDSRFDFYLVGSEREGFLEVKGVTLEEEGLAKFPDAPTIRGTKHIRELGELAEKGECSGVFFVVQMKGVWGFMPNEKTDPVFSETLREAEAKGLHIYVMDTIIERENMVMDKRVSYFSEEPLTVDKATDADLPRVMALIDEGRDALKEDGVDQWQGVDPTKENLSAAIDAGTCTFFKEDGIVGMAVLREDEEPTYGRICGQWLTEGNYLTVHQFVVSKERKGEGMGRRIMDRILAEARMRGFDSVRVDTHADNFRMKCLIENTGFTYCGVITVSDGTERVAYEQVLS